MSNHEVTKAMRDIVRRIHDQANSHFGEITGDLARAIPDYPPEPGPVVRDEPNTIRSAAEIRAELAWAVSHQASEYSERAAGWIAAVRWVLNEEKAQ